MDIMKHKENQWDELKTDAQKALVIGKLEAYKNVVDYFNTMRESLTRSLLVNDIKEEDYEALKKKFESGSEEKSTQTSIQEVFKEIDSHEFDDDGDKISFDNC